MPCYPAATGARQDGMPSSTTRRADVSTGSDVAQALERARPSLERVLARFRVAPAEAEDLLQNVALCFVIKQEEVHDSTRWLVGVLRRECLKYWRSQRRRFTEAIDAGLLDLIQAPGLTLADRFELRFELQRALAGLKTRCRSILYVRYAEGCNDEETAARLGYSLASIDKVVRRCVTALAGLLMNVARRKEEEAT